MNKSVSFSYRITATWEPCDAVILTWPSNLLSDQILEFYEALTSILPDYADVIILSQTGLATNIKGHLESFGIETEHVYIYEVECPNIQIGIWGSLLVEASTGFSFFTQKKDNSHFIESAKHLFPYANAESLNFCIEHGMVETDGVSQIIINKQLCDQKNPEIEFSDIINFLRDSCGIVDFISLTPPGLLKYLPLRLCPGNRLLKTTCSDNTSIYHNDFLRFEEELQKVLDSVDTEFEVINLPWVGELENESNQVYFADYSQFLILNEAILLPLFNLPTDEDAMEILSQVFPGFDILGFPSAALAIANTSLVEICLPVPEGVVEPLYE